MFKYEETRYMQYVAAFSASGFGTAAAMHLSWGSPTFPKLMSDDTPLDATITSGEVSWLASLLLFAAVPSTPLVPFSIDYLGVKGSLLFSAVLMFVPWIIYIFATNWIYLIIGRVIAGLAMGFVVTDVMMYIGEISDSDIRGKLTTTYAFCKLFGSFITLTFGPVVSYTTLSIIGGSVTIVSFTILCFMPESPYYLAKYNKEEQGKRALRILAPKNCNDIDIDKKWETINVTVRNAINNRGTFLDFFTKNEHRKVIGIMFGVRTFQVLSGAMIFEPYLQTIVKSSQSSISQETSSLIFGIIQFPAAILCSIMVDKLGRKPMLMLSMIGCTVCLISQGIYFFLQDITETDIEIIGWLPTVALAACLFFSILGINNLPYVLLGELFPASIKEVGVTVITTYGVLLGGGGQKLFETVTTAWGYHVVFWFFAAVNIIGTIFAYLVIPETKNKTFDEIQTKIHKENPSNS